MGRKGVRADFVVVACITAHAFLEEVQRRVAVPLLDMVDETLRRAVAEPGVRRIGLLATTGTLAARVYQAAAERVATGVEVVSLLETTDRGRSGEWLQEHLVMESVYGPLNGTRRRGGGLKSGAVTGAVAHEAAARFGEAGRILAEAGADLVILGCTEIPAVLTQPELDKVPLVDPLAVTAEAAVDIAAGARPLPSLLEAGALPPRPR
jgi:aspartate racemase